MERPINSKHRENAILKFLLVCLISLLLVGYHVFITRSVIQVESKNNAALEAPVPAIK